MTSIAPVRYTGTSNIPTSSGKNETLSMFSDKIVKYSQNFNVHISQATQGTYRFSDRSRPFYMSQEERVFKRDLDELQGYAHIRGAKRAVALIIPAIIFNCKLSAYQVAFNDAQREIQATHRSEIVPLVIHVEHGQRGPAVDRLAMLINALERIGVSFPTIPDREVIFMNIYQRLKLLNLSLEEHAALYVLAADIRAASERSHEIDFEPPIPLDQFFNKA